MSARDDDAAELLLSVTRMLMSNMAARFRQQDLGVSPATVGILARISEGDCKLSELAQRLCVRLPTISRSVSLLVERKLVERWVPATDRRTTMVRLTPQGRKILRDLMRDAKHSTGAVLATLTPRERATVRAGLELVSKALTTQQTETTGVR